MRVTDVAADTFADILNAALFDLLRQERISDGRTRRTDHVLRATADNLRHGIGRSETAHGDNWFAGHGFGAGDVWHQGAFFHKPRIAHFDIVIRAGQIPQIRQVGQHGEGVIGFAVIQIDAEPCSNGGFSGDGFQGFFDQFAHQSHAVLQGTAIFIRTRVGQRVEEFRQQIAMRRIDINDVKSGGDRTFRGITVPFAQVANILFVDLAGLAGMAFTSICLRAVAQAECGNAGAEIDDHAAAQPQLDPGQSVMRVDRVGHQGVAADIVVVPQGGKGKGVVVGSRMNRTIFGVHNPPATLGFDAAHGGQSLRATPAHAGTMRHLIESVFGGDRANFDRFKQNIMLWVAHFGLDLQKQR